MDSQEEQKLESRQRIHMHLMAACGTIGVIIGVATVVSIGFAIFGNLSWWWPIGLGLAGAVFNGAAKEYRKEAMKIGIERQVKYPEGE